MAAVWAVPLSRWANTSNDKSICPNQTVDVKDRTACRTVVEPCGRWHWTPMGAGRGIIDGLKAIDKLIYSRVESASVARAD